MLWLEAAADQVRSTEGTVNAWLDARERAREKEGWLSDLARARRLAEAGGARALGLRFRYALLGASEAGVATGLSDLLVVELVTSGAWTAAQGLAHVRRLAARSEPVEIARDPPAPGTSAARLLVRLAPSVCAAGLTRPAVELAHGLGGAEPSARALAALAAAADDAEREPILAGANAAARAIAAPADRARTLLKVVALDSRGPAFDEAVAAARAEDDPEVRAGVLAAVAAVGPAPRRHSVLLEALSAARAAPIEAVGRLDGGEVQSRDQRLHQIALALADLDPAAAVAAGREIRYAAQLAEVLTAALPRVAEADRKHVFTQAWAAAQKVFDRATCAKLLAQLAPFAPEDEQDRIWDAALDAARVLAVPATRAEALISLLPFVPAHRRRALFDEAHAEALGRAGEREPSPEALAALVAYAGPEDRRAVIAEALAAARTPIRHADGTEFHNQFYMAWAFTTVARALPPHERRAALDEALAAARKVDSVHSRLEALERILPLLPANELRSVAAEALLVAGRPNDSAAAVSALSALLPSLPPERRSGLTKETLRIARTIDVGYVRADALARLAPWVPSNLQTKALEIIQGGEKDINGNRIRAVLALLADAPPAQRDVVLARELEAIAASGDDGREKSLEAFEALAPSLPPETARQALMLARNISGHIQRAMALRAVAKALPESERDDVLGEALKAVGEFRLAWEPPVPDMLSIQGLDVPLRAQALGDALAKLAPELSEVLAEQALAIARTIVATRRQWQLARVPGIGHVPSARALQPLGGRLNAMAYRGLNIAIRALGALPPRLHERVLDGIGEVMSVRVPQPLHQVLESVGLTLRPLLRDLNAMATADRQFVSRIGALAALLPRLPERERGAVRREIVKLGRTPMWPGARAFCLCSAAIAVPEEPGLIDDALSAASEAAEEHIRAGIVAELAPLVNGPALERALTIAATLKEGDRCADALAALAPRLTAGTSEQAVALATAIEREGNRSDALARMAPFLAGRARAMACAAIRGVTDAYARASGLAALAAATGDGALVLEALTALADPQANAASGIDELGPAIAALRPARRLESVVAAVRAVDARPRSDILLALTALAPVVASLGHAHAVADAADAIVATRRWFP